MIAYLRNLCCFAILCGAPLSLTARGGEGENLVPFHVRNMNPFVLIHPSPAASSSYLLADGDSTLQLTGDVANNSIQSESDEEIIRLDGETYRLGLTWTRGIAADWQVAIELPLLTHREGMMDGLIENWHDLFQLSNFNRDDWSRNRLVYFYENSDGERFRIDRNMIGIGDLVLSLSHALDIDSEHGGRLAIHGSLKLPTGDSDRLFGSGAADLALWLSGVEEHVVWGWPLNLYGQAGLLLKGKSDLLQGMQRDRVIFGALGLGLRPLAWLDLKAQLDGHTAHYHSDLDQLGGAALMLTVGGSIYMDGGSQRIDMAIGENLTTDSIPDFMINLAYVWRLDALN